MVAGKLSKIKDVCRSRAVTYLCLHRGGLTQEGFDGPIVTNPGDDAPTNDVFGPYVPFATVAQYIDPQTDKLFIRFISVSGGSAADPYNMKFDYVWFLNPPAPEG